MSFELLRPRATVWHLSIGPLLFLVPFVFAVTPVSAQVMVAGEESTEENAQTQPPFLLPAQPTEITEAMEDFRRFAGRKQWEKAFKHLEKVFAATSNGLVLTADGIMLPSRMIAREALLELPVPGQDAYRLFFDAEAKKILEQATGKEELPKLSQIFSRFLVTSVGDTAADRLGDLNFEAGNLAQAVNAWRTILEQRPDTQISKARLRVKIAVALIRQEHWSDFAEVMKTIEQQHAAEKMVLGGKSVLVAEHLKGLADRARQNASNVTSPTTGGLTPDFPLDPKAEPLWQFRFLPIHDPKSGTPAGLQLQNRWGGNQTASDWVPPVLTDGNRLYVNFLGYDLGLDMDNGKLLWRSGRFFDAPQKVQQGQLTPLEQHSLGIGAGKIWSIAHESPEQGQQQNAKFGIVSREMDTGKKIFHSKQSTELANWSLRGTPLMAGERIYLAATKTNQPRELDVLAISSKDGKLQWSTTIGNYTSDSNPYMMERSFQPSLLLDGGHLYIDSHSGALVRLDAASGQVEWGLNYASEVMHQQRFWGWGYGMSTEPITVGAPQMVNGILYLKGMKSRKLYAVDPQRPRVLWFRSIPQSANLIGVDESRFYVGGEDISAFDLKTRKIQWAVKMSPGATCSQALLTRNRIYHFSPRGVFEIDKVNGKVVNLLRGADLDSLGGHLIVTPKSLLTVSNLAITAYPLASTKTAAGTPKTSTTPEASTVAVGNTGGE